MISPYSTPIRNYSPIPSSISESTVSVSPISFCLSSDSGSGSIESIPDSQNLDALVDAATLPKQRKRPKYLDGPAIEKIIIWRYRLDYSLKHIESLLNYEVSISSIKRYCRLFRNSDKEYNNRIKQTNRKQGSGRKRKWTEDDENMIVEIQERFADITYKGIQAKFKEWKQTNEVPSKGTIYRILDKFQFTTKQLYICPVERNSQENKEKRAEYCRKMAEKNESELIFIDEKGWNLHQIRSRGRSRVGQKAYVIKSNARGRNLTLICAISPTQGIVHWQLRYGSVNAEVYADFIRALCNTEIVKSHSFTFVQDNVSFHRTQQVQDVLEEFGIQHKFEQLPPYSPQLNPIEECFSKLSIKMREKNSENTGELISNLEGLMSDGTVTPSDCNGWYRHSIRWYFKCIDMKDLI